MNEQLALKVQLPQVPGELWRFVRRPQTLAVLLPLALLIVQLVIYGALNPRFVSVANLYNLMRQSSVLLLVSTGATFVILVGAIDLSVGAVVTLTAIAVAVLVRDMGWGLWSLPAAAAIGLAAGALNAALHLFGRVPAFLATLGTMGIFTGLSNWLSSGANIVFRDRDITWVASGKLVGDIPNVALWALLLFSAAALLGLRTHFGRYLVVVGAGEAVARLSGVRVRRVKLGAFLMCGLLAGVAGFLLVARTGTGTSRMGDELMLESISAAVIGGTALSGGVGGMHRTIVGVLVIAVMSNGLNVAGVNAFTQIIIKGAVLVLSVALTLDRSKSEFVK